VRRLEKDRVLGVEPVVAGLHSTGQQAVRRRDVPVGVDQEVSRRPRGGRECASSDPVRRTSTSNLLAAAISRPASAPM
jgi:hypothetical protein